MVKKAESDWKTFNLQSQSSSIRKYLDICKDWLVAHEDITEPSRKFCNMPQIFDDHASTFIGMTENEVRNVTIFKCSICSTESNLMSEGKSITANPFSRAQFMIICNECNSVMNR